MIESKMICDDCNWNMKSLGERSHPPTLADFKNFAKSIEWTVIDGDSPKFICKSCSRQRQHPDLGN